MDKSSRNLIQKATQDARRLLEAEFSQQLEGLFDILPDGTIAPEPGKHLDATQRIIRQKIVAAIEHEKASGSSDSEAVAAYLRETSFTYLNRFVALKMLEARGLAQECVSKGERSSGFKEFSGLAPGLAELPDRGYRLYIESLFDELSLEIRVLFDRQNPVSLLWPRRKVLDELLSTLNREEIGGIWKEDETIGWVYQYFNSGEERKKMRDESAAPRNSRELAVRNQFFTPRYVVEFLTDNTLGRIWYEMRKGDTVLKDECRYLVRRPNEIFLAPGENPPVDQENDTDLSQEELLKKTVYFEHQSKKDPRDLRVLDPACGSGHFLLYAFDLLVRIYEEAWEDHESPESEATGHTLRKDFETLDYMRRAVPKLIIEHNLHGIDIDPRAVQIAALALWLRAQKTWKYLGISAAERPRVAKSNIVTAEPMPGEEDMRHEFTESLKPRVLGQLVDVVFDKLKLAGEAGSLLKIEEEIKDAVTEARKQWLEVPKPEQQVLFPGMADPRPKQKELRFDFKGVTDERFWGKAENLILEALEAYAKQAENGHAIRRRLFSEDAARGFAFIDLCRKLYDVVLMNPPYGQVSIVADSYIHISFPISGDDIFIAFLQRAKELLLDRGACGAITSRNWLFNQRMVEFRKNFMLSSVEPGILADLGSGVLDAVVDVAAFTFSNYVARSGVATLTIITSINNISKAESLLESVFATSMGERKDTVFIRTPKFFRNLPDCRLSYAAPASLVSLFSKHLPLDPHMGLVLKGLISGNDERYVRHWVECSSHDAEKVWKRFHKGGDYSPFYSDVDLLLIWGSNGFSMKADAEIKYGGASRTIKNEKNFFFPGIGWSVNNSGFGAKVVPAGCIFADIGPVFQPNKANMIAGFLGFLNSHLVKMVLRLFQVGDRGRFMWIANIVQQLPCPGYEEIAGCAEPALIVVSEFQSGAECDECSPVFLNIYGRQDVNVMSLREGAGLLIETIEAACKRIETACQQIDTVVEKAYGGSFRDAGGIDALIRENERPIFVFLKRFKKSVPEIAKNMISYSLGSAFGRWDVRIVLDSSLAPKLPDPFVPLPVCPPGMLVGPDGLPAESSRIISEEWLRARPDANTLPSEGAIKNPTIPDPDYPLRISWDGILVDDPGFEGGQLHDKDIVLRTRQVLDVLSKNKAQNIEQEVCEILNVPDMRNYFRKFFFQDHIKRYSKSRRKAPIYWQLSTPSAIYSIWLYYHRFTKDTFFKVLNEYVIPKLQFEERELTKVRQQYGASPTAIQRKEIAAREAFVAELTTFKEEVVRIAPLWNFNLNDGVIINFAPLWRLVPQNKPWQKECKKIWDKLVKGDYDWALLAMHLWPERVVKKCTKDRSLAIAHGLEEGFWEEGDKGKWKPKKVSKETIDALIQERTSPTVKSALEDLLKAPIPANMAGKKRKKKA